MKDVQTIVQLEDLEKLKFYESYYQILIDLFIKRNKDASELQEEHQLIQSRIEELENRV